MFIAIPTSENLVSLSSISLDDISKMNVCGFDDEYPCDCCTENDALHYLRKYDVSIWYCSSEEVMFRMEDNPNRDRVLYPGYSGLIHYRQQRLEYCRENNISPTWSMVMDEEDYQEELTMTDEKRAAKAAAKALADAEQDLIEESSRRFRHAEFQMHLNSRGKGKDRHIDKLDQPCKYLYCDESAPKHLWKKKDTSGKPCAPVRMELTGSECWAHEYHDPRTNALMIHHACKYLHPNEDGWRDEWDTNRTFRPTVLTSANRFTNMNNVAPRRPKRVENGAW